MTPQDVALALSAASPRGGFPQKLPGLPAGGQAAVGRPFGQVREL
jgi:hypothetical protein